VTRILRIFGVATQQEFGFPADTAGGEAPEAESALVDALATFRDGVRRCATLYVYVYIYMYIHIYKIPRGARLRRRSRR